MTDKAVLISIRPNWCELIASGEKTVEVRKTKPKLETPFKVYIYETKTVDKSKLIVYVDGNEPCRYYKGKGKVIGEFVCDKIVDIDFGIEEGVFFDGEIQEGFEANGNGSNPTCLSFVELENYLTENEGYGWHISDLVIYDKLKELRQFKRVLKNNTYKEWLKHDSVYLQRPPQSWCYVEVMK